MAGEDTGFLFGVVLVFRSPADVVLGFGTVVVRLVTVLAFVVALVRVVAGAFAGALWTLLILLAVLETWLVLLATVMVDADEVTALILFVVDVTVRGLVAGREVDVRVVAVLVLAVADGVGLVGAVSDFVVVDLAVVLDGLALELLLLVLVDLIDVFGTEVSGFLAAGAAFSSPLTGTVGGFLMGSGFFSTGGLFSALLVTLVRGVAVAVEALLILVALVMLLVVDALLRVVFLTVVVADFVIVVGFAAGFVSGLLEVNVFLSLLVTAGLAGLVAPVVVLDATDLEVVDLLETADLTAAVAATAVPTTAAVAISVSIGFVSLATFSTSGAGTVSKGTEQDVSSAGTTSTFPKISSTADVSLLTVEPTSITKGSSRTSLGAELSTLNISGPVKARVGDGTFKTLSSIMNSFSATTCCNVSVGGGWWFVYW